LNGLFFTSDSTDLTEPIGAAHAELPVDGEDEAESRLAAHHAITSFGSAPQRKVSFIERTPPRRQSCDEHAPLRDTELVRSATGRSTSAA
jgi:hypothetical protein